MRNLLGAPAISERYKTKYIMRHPPVVRSHAIPAASPGDAMQALVVSPTLDVLRAVPSASISNVLKHDVAPCSTCRGEARAHAVANAVSTTPELWHWPEAWLLLEDSEHLVAVAVDVAARAGVGINVA
jgi:hypothetical protein